MNGEPLTFQSDWQTGQIGGLYHDGDQSYYANSFLMDESVNKRRWSVTYESMKANIDTFVGRSVVMIPSGHHPHYSIQEFFKVGSIESVSLNDKSRSSSAYINMNADAASLVYDRTLNHTSVQVAADRRGTKIMNADTPFEYEVCESWRGEHLALVGSPAYKADKAVIDRICQGTAQECRMELPMNASMPKNRHATEGQEALARTIERSIRRLYAPCTIKRIVEDAKQGSDLHHAKEKYPKLAPSEVLAMAVNDGPSIAASLDSIITAYVTGFLKE